MRNNCLTFLPELPWGLNEVRYAEMLCKISNVKQVLFRYDSLDLYSDAYRHTLSLEKKMDSLFN